MNVKVFTAQVLNELITEARELPRKRRHLNIHQSYDEPCQRLFNAVGIDSYIPPHCHPGAGATEDLFAVAGRFALVIFNDAGAIEDVTQIAAGALAEGLPCGAELAPGTWHTVLALTEPGVLLEMKAGPFNPAAPKGLAPWAPAEGSEQAVKYLAELRRHAFEWLGITVEQASGVATTC